MTLHIEVTEISAITDLVRFVLKHYRHVRQTIETGITLSQECAHHSGLNVALIEALLLETAQQMQIVEHQGHLKGLAKKLVVMHCIEQQFVSAHRELLCVWEYWKATLSWFIDQVIRMLNAGRHILPIFVG